MSAETLKSSRVGLSIYPALPGYPRTAVLGRYLTGAAPRLRAVEAPQRGKKGGGHRSQSPSGAPVLPAGLVGLAVRWGCGSASEKLNGGFAWASRASGPPTKTGTAVLPAGPFPARGRRRQAQPGGPLDPPKCVGLCVWPTRLILSLK
jgi:hypothetical protein